MTNQKTPLRIDIVSDVMCPWCVIGYRQLAIALEVTGVDHEIHWHPFELNPNMPAEGQDMREHLVEKYGTTPTQSDANRANMTVSGEKLGFEFVFDDGFRMHNTFHTNQLLHWADGQERRHGLKQALRISQADVIYQMMQCWWISPQRLVWIAQKQQLFWPIKGLQRLCANNRTSGRSKVLAASLQLSLIASIW
jgi:hypothetical protein